jgi:6-phosphogluconolactonase
MSLLAPALLTARHTYILFAGAAKLAIYRRALGGERADELPVAAALRDAPAPVQVYWAP